MVPDGVGERGGAAELVVVQPADGAAGGDLLQRQAAGAGDVGGRAVGDDLRQAAGLVVGLVGALVAGGLRLPQAVAVVGVGLGHAGRTATAGRGRRSQQVVGLGPVKWPAVRWWARSVRRPSSS